MSKYYDDPKYNAAFDRCVDVMAKMVLKYGPDLLQKWGCNPIPGLGKDVVDIIPTYDEALEEMTKTEYRIAA